MPRLSKAEQDAVLAEVKHDLEGNGVWTPSKLVETLNKHIVSQGKAKKIISQAIRNKYRMRRVEASELRDSMRPSNILVHGRSGSGKTEIFRLIAKLYNAPFLRVEATRYTEVGYHGDDITNIIVDLYKKSKLNSHNMPFIAHAEYTNRDASELFARSPKLQEIVESHIMKLILGPKFAENKLLEQKRQDFKDGLLDEYNCFIYVPRITDPTVAAKAPADSLAQFSYIKVKDIRRYMYEVYSDELHGQIDIDEFVRTEIESKGIVVIDEIDKLVRTPDSASTTKASDEGVQYDLLPILDGTMISVNNKLKINTRNILFVGAGAFEKVKPTELAIELQGRMPI